MNRSMFANKINKLKLIQLINRFNKKKKTIRNTLKQLESNIETSRKNQSRRMYR